ncbi:hypothetical protein [Telmatospirillum sp.]|uniref:hypothetical protein n=1 Tax=Telmatospirillum sp. TaxID=2079197 RepID=UPI0028447B13|nr:hypothetical protein [Telmatospirillum sp.]MDR3437265.1 hypothetical protein [Telmatospirillum sp.]
MPDYSQSSISPTPSGADPGRVSLALQRMRGHSRSVWPAEPSFAEMISDPVFQQLMASDRVSMESFTGLVAAVRQRLGR